MRRRNLKTTRDPTPGVDADAAGTRAPAPGVEAETIQGAAVMEAAGEEAEAIRAPPQPRLRQGRPHPQRAPRYGAAIVNLK